MASFSVFPVQDAARGPAARRWLRDALFVLLIAPIGVVGANWDVAWHRTIGRDTFWSPPHLLIYGATLLALFVVLRGIARETRLAARGAPAPGVRLFGLVAPGGYWLALAGIGVVFLAAPFDEWWHRRYGLDVTIWSPPHLVAIAGGLLGRVGVFAVVAAAARALAADASTGPPSGARSARAALAPLPALLFAPLGGWLLLGVGFGLGELDYDLLARTPAAYLPLGSLAYATTLGFIAAVARWPLAATAAALVYGVARGSFTVVLPLVGFVPPAPPPLLFVPALGFDLARWAFEGERPLTRRLGPGAVFALGFAMTEWLWTQMLDGPVWSLGGLGDVLALAMLLGAVGAAAGAALGGRLARP